MKYAIISALVAVSVFSGAAAPRVDTSDVTMSQDPHSRVVTVTYTLKEEPGVITLDIQTNNAAGGWASIGDGNIRLLGGAVNRLVDELDVQQTITWHAAQSWGGRKIAAGDIRAVVKAWATNAPPDYMVVDLEEPFAVFYYPSEAALPRPVSDRIYKTGKLVMRKVPAAGVIWRMGISDANDQTPHYVQLDEDYYLGVYPLTRQQYYLMNNKVNASYGYERAETAEGEDERSRACGALSFASLRGSSKGLEWPNGARHEVDADSAIDRLRKMTGLFFDLPTEAQWQFACRAGSGSDLYTGKDYSEAEVARLAWFDTNSKVMTATGTEKSGTHEVGLKTPNVWGFYDMLGNVSELCLDRYSIVNYTGNASDVMKNPEGPEDAAATSRVCCGGNAWYSNNRSFFTSGARLEFKTTSDPYYSNYYGARLWAPAHAVK